MKKNSKQLQVLLFLGILFLVRPIRAFDRRMSGSDIVFALWPQIQRAQLLKPYAVIADNLRDDFYVRLAALLVVLAPNQQKDTR